MKLRLWPVPYTLRYRLLSMQIIAILLPIVLIGGVSCLSIYHILVNKVERGVELNLKQVRYGLETTLDNMDYVSKQLALDDEVASRLSDYMRAERYDRYVVKREFDTRLTLIKNTNPNAGVMLYYYPASEGILFENATVDPKADPRRLPTLASHAGNGYVLQGPHRSLAGGGLPVFSLLRQVQQKPSAGEGFFYMETNFAIFENLLATRQYGITVGHVLVDQQGDVVYSQRPDRYPVGSSLRKDGARTYDGDARTYLFGEDSSQGWRIYATVSRKDLLGEFSAWLARFSLLFLLSLALAALLARRIWRLIVGMLRRFKREIEAVSAGGFGYSPERLGVMEFDDLMLKFDRMRERIVALMAEVSEKERNKRLLEVEKLKYQINPHFIHNTLNTIQWIARINKQHEIDHLIAVFARLLHYNLGKEGGIVRLSEELQAIRDYVELQGIRYNIKFEVAIKVPEQAEDLRIPGFVLQPLVENSLYHGFDQQDGEIAVEIKPDAGGWLVEVRDNGQGMDEAELARLMTDDPDRRKSGLGIGMRFVDRTLKAYYGEESGLRIRSRKGTGTVMSLRIPSEARLDEPKAEG